MRSCEDFESLLPAYVAGVAASSDASEIGEHLAECEACMNDFQKTVKDLGTLKHWKEESLPEGLASRILERIVQLSRDTATRRAPAPTASWGPDITRWMTVAALTLVIILAIGVSFTARSYARFQNKQKDCADNLRRLGAAAATRGPLRAPLEPRLRQALDPRQDASLLLCPLAEEPKAPQTSNYRLDLPGPTYLAGDYPHNHGGRDANLLMADGSVINVTPAQRLLWEELEASSPSR